MTSQRTTDNQEELFDVVDESDVVIGTTTRGKANRNKGILHRAVYVLVFNQKGELFMHKRSATKDTEPLQWTVSCSGHVLSGDTYEESAHRELTEELGVDLQLEYMDKFIIHYPRETEMTALYKAYSSGPFRLHPQEIKEGRFFSKQELQKAVNTRSVVLSFSGRYVLRHIHWIS